MTVKVPTIAIGSARLGMIVAETLRRKRKMTSTTRNRVSSRVNSTSLTESLIEVDRSIRMFMETEAGSWSRKVGRSLLTASATSTVLVPGWRWTARMMDRVLLGAVEVPGRHLVVFDAVGDLRDVAEPHGRAVAIGDDQRPVGVGIVELPGGLDGKGPVGAVQDPGRAGSRCRCRWRRPPRRSRSPCSRGPSGRAGRGRRISASRRP